jgi:hypothetical protein
MSVAVRDAPHADSDIGLEKQPVTVVQFIR